MRLHHRETSVKAITRSSWPPESPRPPRRHLLRELALTGLLASSVAWAVSVGIGVGIVWYTSHHNWPTLDTLAVIAVVAAPIALVTGWVVTLVRALHLLRMALATALSYTWRALTGLLFLARTGRKWEDDPPTQWL